MSGPSSVPAGERSGRPGITWESTTVGVEHVVDDDQPDPPPPNRATRRAIARAARRSNR